MRIYVGCALNSAPQEFIDRVNSIKKRLEERGHDIVHFLGLGVGTSRDVYNFDIKECVENSDIMLAICDFQSLGLGYEIATMIEKHGRPVIAVAHISSKVSRLIQGIDHPDFSFVFYQDDSDIIKAFEQKIQEYKHKSTH